MTDAVTVALIAAAPAALTAVLAGIVFVQNQRLSRNVQKIEIATNSMKDALVKTTKEAATLQGASDERVRAKNESNMKAAAIAGATVTPSSDLK